MEVQEEPFDFSNHLREKSIDQLGSITFGGESWAELHINNEWRRREFILAKEVAHAQKLAAHWTVVSAIAIALSVLATVGAIWLDVIRLIASVGGAN